jgi:hypothetical protein
MRIRRQKMCRDVFCCVWILVLSCVLGAVLFRLMSQESNADLLARIEKLEKKHAADISVGCNGHCARAP